jgi:Na+/proline symporter
VAPSVGGFQPTVLDLPLRQLIEKQTWVAMLSLFVANVLWMPVDLSTWQRIASVEGQRSEVLRRLRRGTLRVMFESPASWCLGVALGLIINGGGLLPPSRDPSEALSAFSEALANGTAAPYLGDTARWLYPIFIVGCISVMLSTVDSLISAIAFTAHQDLPRLPWYKHTGELATARFWTVLIAAAGLTLYPLIRWAMGANLPTFLYSAYSAQLSLVVVVLMALLRKRIEKRAALCSLWAGFVATAIAFALALRLPDSPEAAVLPPLFACTGAAIGYVLGFNRQGWVRLKKET